MCTISCPQSFSEPFPGEVQISDFLSLNTFLRFVFKSLKIFKMIYIFFDTEFYRYYNVLLLFIDYNIGCKFIIKIMSTFQNVIALLILIFN